MSVRVLVADDQALVRAGLVALLTAAPGTEVVGEAADGDQAVRAARATRPDVILMDIRMPVLNGIAATRSILDTPDEHRPRVIMLTTFDLDEYVYAALREGASGFLLKDTPPQRIISAIHIVAAGDYLIAPDITHRLIHTYAQQQSRPSPSTTKLASLTPRETEVLRLVGTGLTNAEIAVQLVLSQATVKTHIKHTMAKLHLNSRAQAVVMAYETGLVTPTT
ncbi:response regulator [Micromonospora sp. 067-2]|uniref:response regulator n=1 Tax=Micromonospora sp. 067-2 TaxID=2789270 RepID=UPI003979B71D